MKKYLVSLLYSLIIVSCTHKEDVQFKSPEASKAIVKKKEFVFPTVPYAQ
jgi:hypothetical protein